jgi:hypothetical protein
VEVFFNVILDQVLGGFHDVRGVEKYEIAAFVVFMLSSN